MPDTLELIYKIVVIVILCAFPILTAWSYLHHQLKGDRRVRADYIKDKLGPIANTRLLKVTWAESPSLRDYWVPIGSAVVVTIFGAITCLFPNQLLNIVEFFKPDSVADMGKGNWNSFLLTGLFHSDSAEEVHARRWQSLAVMSLAFLGAYVWSAQNIIRRYINFDLLPIEYYHKTLRLILAPLTALMISFVIDAGVIDLGAAKLSLDGVGTVEEGGGQTGITTLTQGERVETEASGTYSWTASLLPVIAFMTGLIPAAVLFFLSDMFLRVLKSTPFYAHHLPLSMIQGLNRFHEVRLSEAGIDNAQNLANADLVELGLTTPYPLEQILDWIDQSRLYVYLRDDLAKARDHRLRTGSDVIALAASDPTRLAGMTDLPALGAIAELLKNDPAQQRITAWRKALMRVDPPDPVSD